VLILKPIITGIAPDVTVKVMVTQFVVMASAQVMNPMKLVQMIVCLQVNVQMDRYLIVMEQMNAGQKAGLVMASQTVKINSMVQI